MHRTTSIRSIFTPIALLALTSYAALGQSAVPPKTWVDKDTGHRGFADVWYKGQFAWEYKKPNSDLNKALSQLRQYSGALGNLR